jgi:hypothetical protein
MRKITRTNFRDIDPDTMVTGRFAGTMGVVETGITALSQIITHIFAAVQRRKVLKKKVEALEAAMEQQVRWNMAMADEIEALKELIVNR